MDVEAAKQRMCDEVDQRASTLLAASHDIHDHPEEVFGEHHAHDLLTNLLEEAGLPVERRAFGLDTAFSASAGTEGPTIAVFLEYDALPGIGHACGHNIIAAAGLGAGLAAAALADSLGGRVRILGSPAEEGGGGKVLMIEEGALEGVDAAMMVHPADADLQWMTTIANQQVEVTYRGRSAHAAAAPWLGRNALDAAVLGYVNVAALRQHIRPEERIHGVFTDGGDKPNIVPSRAAMHWYVRAANLETLQPLKERVMAALAAGATAAECEMEHRWIDPAYADLRTNGRLSQLFAANAQQLGRTVAEPDPDNLVVGSTDMGNVSYVVPSIHPMIAVAPRGTSIHTPEFALHAAGPSGDAAVLDGAKAMAMTVADLWLRPEAVEAATSEFEAAGR